MIKLVITNHAQREAHTQRERERSTHIHTQREAQGEREAHITNRHIHTERDREKDTHNQ